MVTTPTAPGIWTGQKLHFACLVALVVLVALAWRSLGGAFPLAFWVAVLVPIAHQLFVWWSWRLALRDGVRHEGRTPRTYLTCFFALFAGRFVSLGILAWLDRGSLGLSLSLRVLVTVVLVSFGGYAAYSVRRYFGLVRAAGADHFEARFRAMSPVQEGIFRLTRNGMYTYAFMLFWAIAIGGDSAAALVVAAFSHAYIWVHYHATEKPDMRFLYGAGRGAS